MHYTELEIIEKMQFCIKSDPDTIRGYISQLPEWRDVVFKRHIKYINSILKHTTYHEISRVQGYSMEGIENIFRKIQTCLKLELDYKYNAKSNETVKKQIVRHDDKDDMLHNIFEYIKSLPSINTKNINNIYRYQLLKLILEGNTVIDIENKMGISADEIYNYLISSETNTIFNDLK